MQLMQEHIRQSSLSYHCCNPTAIFSSPNMTVLGRLIHRWTKRPTPGRDILPYLEIMVYFQYITHHILMACNYDKAMKVRAIRHCFSNALWLNTQWKAIFMQEAMEKYIYARIENWAGITGDAAIEYKCYKKLGVTDIQFAGDIEFIDAAIREKRPCDDWLIDLFQHGAIAYEYNYHLNVLVATKQHENRGTAELLFDSNFNKIPLLTVCDNRARVYATAGSDTVAKQMKLFTAGCLLMGIEGINHRLGCVSLLIITSIDMASLDKKLSHPVTPVPVTNGPITDKSFSNSRELQQLKRRLH